MSVNEQQESAHTVPRNVKNSALVPIHCWDEVTGISFLKNLHGEPCIPRKVINDWQFIHEIPKTTLLLRADNEGLETMHTVGVSATQDGDFLFAEFLTSCPFLLSHDIGSIRHLAERKILASFALYTWKCSRPSVMSFIISSLNREAPFLSVDKFSPNILTFLPMPCLRLN